MSKQEKKAVTKDQLIGMQVYDSEGNDAGKVQDIAFTFGKMGMTVILKNKSGETKEVDWEEIQAAKDVVILKPKEEKAQAASISQSAIKQPLIAQQSAQGQTPVCPICGEPLTYIAQYQRWYCYKDKQYV
jgi:sporulation protein YlmC with PRC-barrel domain